jgi:hypothetical protein
MSTIQLCPYVVVSDDRGMVSPVGGAKWEMLIVVVGWDYGTEELFLQNSGNLIRMKSYDAAVKRGDIRINRIIGVFVEKLFR